jgi:site-specific recombinase XerD
MSPLRKKMIEAMSLRGFSVRTHQSYLAAVTQLARYQRCSPDRLSVDDIQAFFVHLANERRLSGASCRLYLNGIRFFYLKVLQWPAFDVPITIPKKPQRIPELLARGEVARILSACTHPKHRMLLSTCYGCGLRVSEVVALKVRDIDGERQLLRIVQGKGAKDRLVIISDSLLALLREYWWLYRQRDWLFAGRRPDAPIAIATAQRVFQAAKSRAAVDKIGGIHSLRHAYATHQLADGLPVQELQRLLGHHDIHSTLRYVHWVPNYREGQSRHSDLVAALETDA